MMSPRFDRATTRRRFLQYLAASPLFDGTRASAQNTPVPTRLPDPMVWGPRELDNLISDPKEALDVFDFEPVAKRNVPPAHFGYMVTGIDDEVTLRANREGFLKFHLNPRRLVDVSAVDMTTEIFIRIFLPSTHPNRPSACTKAVNPWPGSFSGRGDNTPTRRTRSGCCACPASGHAAAPPSTVMNSRRLTRSPRRPSRACLEEW
jgi:hypothetical protein